MASKVFLFDDDHWLYCSDVNYQNGVWSGHVENGNWHLRFDENTGISEACQSYPVTIVENTKMVWACDPFKAIFNYNTVIEDAKKRYIAGEPANFQLTAIDEELNCEDDEEEIPF
jgi:uncharacterized GH25 family protein